MKTGILKSSRGALAVLAAFFCMAQATILVAQPSNAPAPPPQPVNWTNRTLNFDNLNLIAPQDPAFTVLGLTPQSIVHPTSPSAFATTLLNGTDQNGNFQSGIAVDVAPYFLYPADKGMNIVDYRQDYWSLKRLLLYGTQFSFATSKGANSNDQSVRLAPGLRFTIFDWGDPRLDNGLDQEFERLTPPFRPTNPTEIPTDNDLSASNAVLKAEQASLTNNWNKPALSIGGAPSWIDKGNGNFTWNGGAAYGSYQYGKLFGNDALIFGLQYFNHEQIPLNKGTNSFFSQDSFLAGANYRVRFPSINLNANIEGAFVHAWPDGLKQYNFGRVAFTLEKKLVDSTWLELSVGQSYGAKNSPSMSILGSLKYSFSPSPKL